MKTLEYIKGVSNYDYKYYLRTVFACGLILLNCKYAFSQADSLTSASSDQFSFQTLNVNDGLSQNSVVSIAHDSIGFLWFATQDGLNRYDGRTFKYYDRHFEDVTRATYSHLGKIYNDRENNFWIISLAGNLEKYNVELDSFIPIKNIENVSIIYQDSQLNLLIGTLNNGVFKINAQSKDTVQVINGSRIESINDIIEFDNKILLAGDNGVAMFPLGSDEISILNSPIKHVSSFSQSSKGLLFAGTHGGGLYFFDKAKKTFLPYTGINMGKVAPTLNIQDLLFDKNDRLWIGTYGNGVYLINFGQQRIEHFTPNKYNPQSLSYNDVLCIFEDHNGTIWLGTDGGGVSYYDEHLFKFSVLTDKQVPQEIKVNVIRSITEDNEGNIWIGTSGEGLTQLNIQQPAYKTFTTKNSSLLSNRVVSLAFIDGQLWIGHQGEGLQILGSDGKFTNYNESTSTVLPASTIWKIYQDSQGRIWLGTRNNGLIQFDSQDGVKEHYKGLDNNGPLASSNVRTLVEGEKGILYVGADDGGLTKIDIQSKAATLLPQLNYKIKSLYYHDQGTLWIGTNGDGLVAYDLSSDKIKTYTTKNGLLNNVIYGVLKGESGNLWLSSNRGLSQLNPENSEIVNYSNYDGLQASEFNTGAYFKSSDHTLYFGGLEGLNWFKPSQLSANTSKPRTVISKFEVFNEAQPLNENLVLPYNRNTVTLTFASLHFSQPERNQYKYKLLNHDQEWKDAGNYNIAHYTNLNPADYEFKVISSNYDGVWNEEPASFTFSINKPWYWNSVAIVIYILALFLGVYMIVNYFKYKWQMKLKLDLEHEKSERLKKLNDFKTKLYTNISHEIRTPLTLINGPIENQLQKKNLSKKDRDELLLVKSNSDRLLNLVNQMSDLALIDSGELKLKVGQGNLSALLNQIINAFRYKAQKKKIKISSQVSELNDTWFNQDIIEKICSNLLNNAVKYAPEGTVVYVNADSNSNNLILNIINQNSYISVTDLSKIFGRFYQNDSQSDGIGVGLALVKELVILNKGQIVASNINQRDIQFTVTIPIGEDAFSEDEKVKTVLDHPKIIEPIINDDIINTKDYTILLVEDNDEIRKLLYDLLQDKYNLLQAANGLAALDIIQEKLPDIVISDIMMPFMDGMELCKNIKTDSLTSHIPVILLTAKVGEENEMKGYDIGADAYITKPFDPKILVKRLHNLLKTRLKLRKFYAESFGIKEDLKITNTEKEFLSKIKLIIEEHITDPQLSADKFSILTFMSRSHLHRKLKAITGMSTTEFIRHHRLNMGKNLLIKSDAPISEIAYQVGFNTPSYFTRCFKASFNTSPEEFRKAQ
ncbi:Signal transduction histidine kinase [Flavobacteriaceae bacterium MAR_2010_188]|nr:Signal transduction histidine kinase [Flavobacteriaceae bacterium MAR_2010_188]